MIYPPSVPLKEEIYSERTRILLIFSDSNSFVHTLKKKLMSTHAQISESHIIPSHFNEYDVYFVIDQIGFRPDALVTSPHRRFVIIYFNRTDAAEFITSYAYSHHTTHIKVINLDSSLHWFDRDVETILWFVFTSHEDIFLHIYHPPHTQSRIHVSRSRPHPLPPKTHSPRSPSQIIRYVLFVILVVHFLFLIPLLLASGLNAWSISSSLSKKQIPVISHTSKQLLAVSEYLFHLSEPSLRLINCARPFESLLLLNTSTVYLSETAALISSTLDETLMQISLTQHDASQSDHIERSINHIFEYLKRSTQDLQIISARAPSYIPQSQYLKSRVDLYARMIPQILEWEPYINSIFASNGTKTYVFLFANNMELRPGGGFIGSYAVVTIDHYHLTQLKVYDVYDADGQLKDHIDPPEAIATYLNQPHWYLRDSAFSPDFVVNFARAKQFLDTEMQMGHIDGGGIITATAVQQILQAIGPVSVDDFGETVTGDNFYLKAQLYAENGFFPGSLQKKSFLSSLMNSLLGRIDSNNLASFVSAITRALDEKQIALTVNDPSVSKFLEQKYWSGRMLQPQCEIPGGSNCILDYLFPVDANLGVNKANFFIKRPLRLDVKVSDDGIIHNKLTAVYTNNSQSDLFPGGPYKNYFQLFFAPNTTIDAVLIDGNPAENMTETNFAYKSIGVYFIVPPQQSKTISVSYTLPSTILSGSGIYQLIFQKQLGSATDDLAVHIDLPDNLVVNQGEFSPLVKNQKIDYNTSISSDKIIVIEFRKK